MKNTCTFFFRGYPVFDLQNKSAQVFRQIFSTLQPSLGFSILLQT